MRQARPTNVLPYFNQTPSALMRLSDVSRLCLHSIHSMLLLPPLSQARAHDMQPYPYVCNMNMQGRTMARRKKARELEDGRERGVHGECCPNCHTALKNMAVLPTGSGRLPLLATLEATCLPGFCLILTLERHFWVLVSRPHFRMCRRSSKQIRFNKCHSIRPSRRSPKPRTSSMTTWYARFKNGSNARNGTLSPIPRTRLRAEDQVEGLRDFSGHAVRFLDLFTASWASSTFFLVNRTVHVEKSSEDKNVSVVHGNS